MFFLIFFCTLLSALIKFDITSQDLDTKRLLYPENDASVDKITVTKSFNLESCTWDDSPSYAALFGLQQNICFFSHANSKQVASQFISEATPRADNLKLVETNVRTSTEERDSLVNLPPLEDAAVGDMEQNPIPTFNEFHAMLSEEQGGLKADPGSTRTDALFSHDKRIISAGGPTSDDTYSSNGSLSDNDQLAKGEQSDIQDANLSPVPLRLNEAVTDTNESKHTEISMPDASAQITTDSIQTDQNKDSAMDNAGLSNDGTYTSASVTLRRNVAASGCFAKLLEASKAIKNPDAVLNENTDEYMNVPCSAEKWFVIEVCEPVMLREIEVANYELFSSRVKLFRVFVSDRYPAKTWDTLGTFTALDVKGKQTFKVNGDKLIKYVKFDLVEHYGSEHYCPLTMVRLFGRVSDDLDDEEDELNESLNHEAHPVASEEKINHAANTNGASVVQAGNDRVSDNAAASLHATSTKASPDQQSLHVNRTATGSVHTVSEASSSGLDEHSSAPSADIDSSQLVPNLKGASIPSQILHTSEPIQAGKDAVKPYDDQMSRTDKPTFSSPSDISGDTCRTDLSNSCFTRGSSGDATANIADGRIRRRIEPIYPADDSQPPAAFPPSSTIHATIVPLRVSDRFPVNGRTSLGGSNVVISFLTRVRDFFLDIFGSSIHLTAGKSDTREYNLSAIDLCPRHLSAIGALLSYGLLSHPDTTSSPDLMITLSERQLRGLRSLEQCFHLLDQRTYVFNSDHLNPQLAVHHRVLVLPKNADDPVMANCNAATQLLNMVFAPNNDSSSHRNSQETAKYNILQLFLAYQYRIQLHRTLSNVSYHRAPISPIEHMLYPWWISGGDRELVPHIQSTCPKLPDFLSHLMHLTPVDPPVLPTPGSTRCSNTSSTIVPREPIAPHQRSSNTVMREQIVVPAALAGSRKDTALMRLTNRVRLLERNVSVSMRYLEELSQSYKRQMERLSRSFNLTTAWLKATAQGAEERDQAQQTRISVLEQRLDELLSQFRSASIEFQDSNSSATSDSKRERDLTLELEEVSAPPALNFDAPPDWNPSASVWPPLSDDWLEDGVVETEDDDPIESHQHPSDSDRFRHIRPYRAESVLPASDWSARDCEPQVASNWKSAVQRWFIERFDSLLKFTNLSWQLLPTSSPNVFWILYMTLLHLTFAAASHALVYLTWLRPQGRKLSCTFDSLSFVHQTPLAWTCSPHHLTLSGPSSYRVPNTNCLQAHNVTVLPSNGDYGLGLSTLPENHTTEHPKFRPLAAASLTNSGSNSVDTIGSSIPVGSDTHQLPDLGSLQKEPLHSALPLNNDVQVPHPAANRCSDCSETYIPRVPVPNEPLQIRVDDSSSSTPSSKCVASLDQPSPPVLSKRARKRHNKRARANWNAQ